MMRKTSSLVLILLIAVGSFESLFSQTSYTSTSATGAWFTTRWNNSADGPTYTSAFTSGNNALFTSGTYSFAGMGSSTAVGNITLNDNVTVLLLRLEVPYRLVEL